MLRPEEVEAMVGLYEFGWGTKRIAEEFGCSRNTVKRYVATAGWVPYGSPLARFEREAALSACAGRPPFGQLRDLIRMVHADCSMTVGTNAHSVPWRLIGERIRGGERRSDARVPRPGHCGGA